MIVGSNACIQLILTCTIISSVGFLYIQSAVNTGDNAVGNSGEITQKMVSTDQHYLVPHLVAQRIAPRVLERMRTSGVSKDCQFDAMNLKRNETALQWNEKRYAVYECSGGCGGLGDRIKGIFSVFLHAVAIGYEFQIDWNSPCLLYPEILGPSRWVNWTKEHSPKGEGVVLPHRLRMMDTGASPFKLCEWRSHQTIIVKTNGNTIPRGSIDCDSVPPTIGEILSQQSFAMSCVRENANHVSDGIKCMGCVWWYLFRMGTLLETQVAIELDRLALWKKNERLEHAFAIALHIRTGDSKMNAGSGREADINKVVQQMQLCTSELVKRVSNVNGTYYGVVVSDSENAKQLVKSWTWLKVYAVDTKPFHIDRNTRNSMHETKNAVLSVLVDLFILSFQDILLLSGSSGYGRLAQSVGMFSSDNVVECIVE